MTRESRHLIRAIIRILREYKRHRVMRHALQALLDREWQDNARRD